MSDLLITGSNAVKNSQLALNVVSNNIANVNTEGYVKQSLIYQSNRHWFKKVHSYTSLGLRHQNSPAVNYQGFTSSRRKFFKKFGYSGNNIIENLEVTFRLNDAAFRLPEFLPRFILNSESKAQDQNVSINSPFIVSETIK